VSAGRRLVHHEERSDRTEGRCGHGLDQQAEFPADDGSDVAHGVALVVDGVSRRAGHSLLEGEPEEHGCVEGVDGRPALGAVTRVAGHAGAAGDGGEQPGEATLAE
jgi:hypothetical protein